MPFSVDADAGWTPLYLSTIAGMSTCLGALIGEWSVFVILFCILGMEVSSHSFSIIITTTLKYSATQLMKTMKNLQLLLVIIVHLDCGKGSLVNAK